MSSMTIVAVYLAVGLATSIAVRLRRVSVGRLGAVASLAVAVALWPYVVPYVVGRGSREPGGASSDGGATREAIRQQEQQLRTALRRGRRVDGVSERVEEVGARFGQRLRRLDARLAELDQALDDAPDSVRERLARLREQRRRELDDGLRLMDELAGKLTLLSFSEGEGAGDGAMDEVQELIRRLEELSAARREGEAVGA